MGAPSLRVVCARGGFQFLICFCFRMAQPFTAAITTAFSLRLQPLRDGNFSNRTTTKSRVTRHDRKNTTVGEDLKTIRSFCLAIALAVTFGTASVQAQEPTAVPVPSQEATALWAQADVSLLSADAQQTGTTPAGTATDGKSSQADAPAPKANPPQPANSTEEYGKQPKRILWVVPNYRAVSANTTLPPLSFKSELWLATQDTFDYSDFIFVAGLAGVDMAGKSQPSFGHGAEGYGKYYWHVFADGGIENYMTEAIVPAATKEDPRYYTLGKGGFFKRTGYAVSRLFITKTNS